MRPPSVFTHTPIRLKLRALEIIHRVAVLSLLRLFPSTAQPSFWISTAVG